MPTLVKDNIAVVGIPTSAACPAFAHRGNRVGCGRPAARGRRCGRPRHDEHGSVRDGLGRDAFSARNAAQSGRARSDTRRIQLGIGGCRCYAASCRSRSAPTPRAPAEPAACTNTVGLKPTRGLVSTPRCRTGRAGSRLHLRARAHGCRRVPCSRRDRRFRRPRSVVTQLPPGRGPDRAFPIVGWISDAVITAECESASARAYCDTRTIVDGLAGSHGIDVTPTPFFAAGSQVRAAVRGALRRVRRVRGCAHRRRRSRRRRDRHAEPRQFPASTVRRRDRARRAPATGRRGVRNRRRVDRPDDSVLPDRRRGRSRPHRSRPGALRGDVGDERIGRRPARSR